MAEYLHHDPEWGTLLSIVAGSRGVDMSLVEKDYWIMHVLYGMQKQGFEFELKGGTSLSKGYGLIHRFSEDIDIHIRNDLGLPIEGNPDSRKVRTARREFYDRLASSLQIDGITRIERDHTFDDTDKYRSGGIRLHFPAMAPSLDGVKEGILLEVGFDTVMPNTPRAIGSWVWDHVRSIGKGDDYLDNQAQEVFCYHPGYTLVEKLQTIVRKYRNRNGQRDGTAINFMRQYYDLYCLLKDPDTLAFIGTEAYYAHKQTRLRGKDAEIPLSEHPAFLLEDPEERLLFEDRYRATSGLYYQGQPPLSEVLGMIQAFLHRF